MALQTLLTENLEVCRTFGVLFSCVFGVFWAARKASWNWPWGNRWQIETVLATQRRPSSRGNGQGFAMNIGEQAIGHTSAKHPYPILAANVKKNLWLTRKIVEVAALLGENCA